MARWRAVAKPNKSGGDVDMTSISNGEDGLSVRTKLNNMLERYDQDGFANVAALMADTTLTYSTVTAGDIVRTRSEGFAYQVAASGATDHHVVTAGGVKLYVLAESGEYPIEAFSGTAKARIETFIALANAGGGNCALVFDATKNYVIASSVSAAVTVSNVRFDGRGAKITITAGDIFTFGNGVAYSEGGIVENFDIVGSSVDATSRFVRLNYGGRFTLRNIICNGVATLFDGGGLAAGKSNSAATIASIVGRCANLENCSFIRRGTTFAMTVRDTTVFVDYAGVGYALTGRNFLDDNEGEGRSTLKVSNVLAERFYRGINILATSCTAVDYIFSDVVLDSCYEIPLAIEGGASGVVSSIIGTNVWATGLSTGPASYASARLKATASGGAIAYCRFSNGWFNGGKFRGIELSGTILATHLNGCFFGTYEPPGASKIGVLIDNTTGTMRDVAVVNCQVETENQGVSRADYGIYVEATAPIAGLRITGNSIGATIQHLTVPTFSSASRSMLVERNNFVVSGVATGCGWKTGGIFVAPASGVYWANTTAQPVEVTVYGGTVSGLKVVDAKSNTEVDVSTSGGTFRLDPADQIVATYSVAPTFMFRVFG